MAGASPWIVDVTYTTFEKIVLRAPGDTLIVVDFWADWCGPCRMVAPVLEKLADSYKGKLVVAKVNVDQEPNIAAAFAIQGIPALKFFLGGQLVHEMVGAHPEHELRRAVEALLPGEKDSMLDEAMQLLENGDEIQAEQALLKVLESEPENAAVNCALARLALRKGDTEAARKYAETVPEGSPEFETARSLLDGLQFAELCSQHGGLNTCLAAVERDANDLEARFRLGCCYAAEAQFEKALETLLTVIAKNKNYGDGKVKEAMVRIFGIVGQRSPLADEYRQKLINLLY